MITTFLAYQAATALTSMHWLGIGALAGSSSTLLFTLLFNTSSTSSSQNSNPLQDLIENTKEQTTHLKSDAEALLESTHRLHERLHQQVKDNEHASNEYAQIRQAVFQSLKERQALEKNITSVLRLFESEESQLLKTISELPTIKIQKNQEIALLQAYMQSLLQCIEEKDILIESLQVKDQNRRQLTI